MMPPRLPRFRALGLLASGLLVCLAPLAAQNAQPEASEILRQARFTAALQEGDLEGELAAEKTKIPFRMTMADQKIHFSFTNPEQRITLHLGDDRFLFTETLADGKEKPVPATRHAENLRGTDITYEDLALRFLFWKDATILEVVEFKGRKAWKIRINNPGAPGPYSVVYAWIDQESAALLRVQGYNQKGECVKQFEVLSGMKVENGWMLKEMRVETMVGNPGKVASRTYLRLDKPKKAGRKPDW
ncbi:MAG: outer membrane lipoprotein-sorting protein [Verrucomicrobiales bacterium]